MLIFEWKDIAFGDNLPASKTYLEYTRQSVMVDDYLIFLFSKYFGASSR